MKTRNTSQHFDDDFEVTYEEELSFHYDMRDTNTEEISYRPRYAERRIPRNEGRANDGYQDRYDDEGRSNSRYQNRYNNKGRANDRYRDRYDDRYDDDDVYEADMDSRYDSVQSRREQQKLAAPIQKGMNAISFISGKVVRNLTLLLILAIIGIMAHNFWRGSALYGDLAEAFRTGELSAALAAYVITASLFLFHEVIAFFWSMTRLKERDRYGTYRVDTGRGLTSFILLYVYSYASFLLSGFLPESPDVIRGVRGALTMFGSLHNALFGLCVAGVIVCLIRKFKNV